MYSLKPQEKCLLTHKLLSEALSEDLIKKMEQAVFHADVDLFMSCLEKVDKKDHSLCDELRRLAENFEYDHLLKLLKTK